MHCCSSITNDGRLSASGICFGRCLDSVEFKQCLTSFCFSIIQSGPPSAMNTAKEKGNEKNIFCEFPLLAMCINQIVGRKNIHSDIVKDSKIVLVAKCVHEQKMNREYNHGAFQVHYFYGK